MAFCVWTLEKMICKNDRKTPHRASAFSVWIGLYTYQILLHTPYISSHRVYFIASYYNVAAVVPYLTYINPLYYRKLPHHSPYFSHIEWALSSLYVGTTKKTYFQSSNYRAHALHTPTIPLLPLLPPYRVGASFTYKHHKKPVFSVDILNGSRLIASCDGVMQVLLRNVLCNIYIYTLNIN